jgi:HK97 family phage major capsid protein
MEEQVLKSIENKITELKENINSENKEKFETIEGTLEAVKEGTASKEDVAKLVDGFDKLAEDVAKATQLKIDNSKTAKEKFTESLRKAVEIVKERKGGFVKVDKTVGTMSLGSSVTGQLPDADRETGITSIVRQRFVIRDSANVFGTNSKTVEWVEQQNIEGGAGQTAEGASKTQLDWEYIVREATVKKITSFVKITNEMLDDIEGMRGEIDSNLAYQLMLQEESQLITGDGTGQNLNGIEKYAQPLDLAALSGTIVNPNYMDVLGAAITQIRENGKGELEANRIFLKASDLFLMVHASKATTAEYVNPITVVPNVNGQGFPSQVYIWGVPVVVSDSITAGEFIVADMTKFNIRDKAQMVIEVGYENDDFTKNLVTIRGEKRLATYAKTNHTEAFVTDTFADGITFLTKAS